MIILTRQKNKRTELLNNRSHHKCQYNLNKRSADGGTIDVMLNLLIYDSIYAHNYYYYDSILLIS